ncbi:aminoglycoside adenylyltransferase domain-containing protein [Halobacillus faecis]|uniref:Spectinomycin 9-adenylyltransferase n=1 Tax=Halobacillus faecis TaxID=360184 RepID=A0A511WUT0_9BACI|nr:aminoglycoside adenylyltransferase domain-containing protein [Halobacillus faecis]GEN54924.1 adenylyltransferase [Halobacillus faecis]
MIDSFLVECTEKFHEIIGENLVGVYLHGSLVLGGFIPERSDVDLIVVTEHPMSKEDAEQVTGFLLEKSGSPFPIEISFMNQHQLNHWQHPSPYDYHYSEAWRERFLNGGVTYSNHHEKTDPDLAAHVTILSHKGCVLFGRPITEVFPSIPEKDYLDSILNDYEDCLDEVLDDPVYAVLNILRVYLYLEEGKIYSKDEAGRRAMRSSFSSTIEKVLKRRRGEEAPLSEEELLLFQEYYREEIKRFLYVKHGVHNVQ